MTQGVNCDNQHISHLTVKQRTVGQQDKENQNMDNFSIVYLLPVQKIELQKIVYIKARNIR